jgi:hypothetical protein
MARRPAGRLLGQNSELRADRVYNWSLPAWSGRLPDGRTYNTCPSAGVCRKACYALSGTYRFSNVLGRHQANLQFVLDDLDEWQQDMTTELAHERYHRRWIRIHDAGDFFSDEYLQAWLEIAAMTPTSAFYCYTKEVARFRRLVEGRAPRNFFWVYSYGGTQDHLLDDTSDRVADVFPDEAAIDRAGYANQEASDLLAVLGPSRVGIPANRIPHFIKAMRGRTFREWQQQEPTGHRH